MLKFIPTWCASHFRPRSLALIFLAVLLMVKAMPSSAQDAGLAGSVVTIDFPAMTIKVSEPVQVNLPVMTIKTPEPVQINLPVMTIKVPDPVQVDFPVMTIKAPGPIQVNLPVMTIITEREENAEMPEKDPPEANVNDGTINEDNSASDNDDPNTRIGVATGERNADDPPLPRGTVTTPPPGDSDFICAGTFGMIMNVGMVTGGGTAVPVGVPETAIGKVGTKTCGRSLFMNAQGQSITLTETAPKSQIYKGDINLGDGAQRTLTLTCTANGNLHGAIAARGSNITAGRKMWLRYKNGRESAVSGCPR